MMKKVPANKEIDELLDKVMSDHLVRHTCQFFEKRENGLKPYGSGVFVLLHNTHFIFTASHVAKAFEDPNKDLYIRVGKTRYINVLGEIKYTDLEKTKGLDLAYIKLDNQMIEPLTKPYKFLPINKILKHNVMLDAMHYCVIGFPENNITHKDGFLDTGAEAFFTKPSNDKPYKYYGYDKNLSYIVEIKGKGTNIRTGQNTPINMHFYGISGCGLWYLSFYTDTDSNVNEVDYKLIGIMTEYKRGKYFCLIGNKIHFILEAISTYEKMNFKEKPI